MEVLGQVKTAKELNRKGHIRKYILSACYECGKERWVPFVNNSPSYFICNSCNKKLNKNGRWLGGQTIGYGYKYIKLTSDNFFFSMTDAENYVPEHRLVMAKSLGRCLWDWEVVHHINANRMDNRLENLLLLTQSEHAQLHKKLGEIN